MADFSQIRIDSINRVQRPGTKLLHVNMIIFFKYEFFIYRGPPEGGAKSFIRKKIKKKRAPKIKIFEKSGALKAPCI